VSRRKILTVVGARPEFIKAMAVSRAIGASETCREVMVHTGQHFDAGMSDVFFLYLRAERQEPVASAVRSRGRAGPPRKDVSSRGPLSRLCSLVENAAKYGAPPITLSAARDGERITLTVSDEGRGIPVADREWVFAPFYRGDPAARILTRLPQA